jgi:hypothetical protein
MHVAARTMLLITGAAALRITNGPAFREHWETARDVCLEVERNRIRDARHHEGDTATVQEWGRLG